MEVVKGFRLDANVTPKEVGNARRGENAARRTTNGKEKVEFEIAVIMEIER